MHKILYKISFFVKRFFEDRNNLAMLGVIFLALLLRLLGLNKGIWDDEAGSIGMITRDSILDVILALRADTHPPLYFILLKFWSFISLGEWWLRLFSVLLSMATIAITMSWLKRYSNLASNLAGLGLATLPLMLRFSHEIRPYPLLVFATALSFYFASKIISDPRKLSWYFALSLSMGMAVATHFVGIMIVMPVYAYILLGTARHKSANYWGIIISSILPGLLLALLILWHSDVMASRSQCWWMPSPNLWIIKSIVARLSGIRSARFFFSYLQSAIGSARIYLDYLFRFILASLAILMLLFGKWRAGLPMLVAALIFWLEMYLFSALFIPILVDRTALPIMIPLIGYISLLLITIDRRKIRVCAIAIYVLICIIFCASWALYQAWVPIENLKGMSRTMKSHWDKNSLIVFYPSWFRDFKYYYPEFSKSELIEVMPIYVDYPLGLTDAVIAKKRLAKFRKELDARIYNKAGGFRFSKTCFVFCWRNGDEHELHIHRSLVSILKEKLRRGSDVHILLSIRGPEYVHKSSLNDYSPFLSHLKAEFGQPLVTEKHPGFVYLKYRIAGVE